MAQKMLQCKNKIADIVTMPWTPEIDQHIFTVIATVDGVCHQSGWFYATCSQCSKRLAVYNGSFWCNICNGSSLYPMVRFMIHLCVRDDSGDAIFTMFNQQTEQLIDTSANKLLNRLGIGSNEYPAEITNLTGRTFAFKIRMPDYFNLDYDFHHHRVVRISEINPLPAAQFPVKAQKKVKRKRICTVVSLLHKEEGPNNKVPSVETAGSTCKGDEFVEIATPAKSQ